MDRNRVVVNRNTPIKAFANFTLAGTGTGAADHAPSTPLTSGRSRPASASITRSPENRLRNGGRMFTTDPHVIHSAETRQLIQAPIASHTSTLRVTRTQPKATDVRLSEGSTIESIVMTTTGRVTKPTGAAATRVRPGSAPAVGSRLNRSASHSNIGGRGGSGSGGGAFRYRDLGVMKIAVRASGSTARDHASNEIGVDIPDDVSDLLSEAAFEAAFDRTRAGAAAAPASGGGGRLNSSASDAQLAGGAHPQSLSPRTRARRAVLQTRGQPLTASVENWMRLHAKQIRVSVDPIVRAQYERLFALLDENSSGSIDLKELKSALDKLGLRFTLDELRVIARSLKAGSQPNDTKNMELTSDEFANGLASTGEWDQIMAVRSKRIAKGIDTTHTGGGDGSGSFAVLPFALWVPVYARRKMLHALIQEFGSSPPANPPVRASPKPALIAATPTAAPATPTQTAKRTNPRPTSAAAAPRTPTPTSVRIGATPASADRRHSLTFSPAAAAPTAAGTPASARPQSARIGGGGGAAASGLKPYVPTPKKRYPLEIRELFWQKPQHRVAGKTTTAAATAMTSETVNAVIANRHSTPVHDLNVRINARMRQLITEHERTNDYPYDKKLRNRRHSQPPAAAVSTPAARTATVRSPTANAAASADQPDAGSGDDNDLPPEDWFDDYLKYKSATAAVDAADRAIAFRDVPDPPNETEWRALMASATVAVPPNRRTGKPASAAGSGYPHGDGDDDDADDHQPTAILPSVAASVGTTPDELLLSSLASGPTLRSLWKSIRKKVRAGGAAAAAAAVAPPA